MRSAPSARQNKAAMQARYGQVAFNGGHPTWARFHFNRAVHGEPTQGFHIGSFYRDKALFDQDRMAQRTYTSEDALQRDSQQVYDYHWLAKYYLKRALPRSQHDVSILSLLAEEYQQLANLAARPRRAQAYQAKADHYARAAFDLGVDVHNQQRLSEDMAALSA